MNCKIIYDILTKRMFYSLAKTEAKQGVPTIPPAVAKAKTIYYDTVLNMDGFTGSPIYLENAELGVSNDDKLELERNNEGEKDDVPELSSLMLDF